MPFPWCGFLREMLAQSPEVICNPAVFVVREVIVCGSVMTNRNEANRNEALQRSFATQLPGARCDLVPLRGNAILRGDNGAFCGRSPRQRGPPARDQRMQRRLYALSRTRHEHFDPTALSRCEPPCCGLGPPMGRELEQRPVHRNHRLTAHLPVSLDRLLGPEMVIGPGSVVLPGLDQCHVEGTQALSNHREDRLKTGIAGVPCAVFRSDEGVSGPQCFVAVR